MTHTGSPSQQPTAAQSFDTVDDIITYQSFDSGEIGTPLHNSFNFIKENVNTFYSESTCSDLGDIETFSPYHKLIVVKGYYLVLNTSIECNFNDDGHTEEMKQHKIEMVTPGGVMIEKWIIVKNIMLEVMVNHSLGM